MESSTIDVKNLNMSQKIIKSFKYPKQSFGGGVWNSSSEKLRKIHGEIVSGFLFKVFVDCKPVILLKKNSDVGFLP